MIEKALYQEALTRQSITDIIEDRIYTGQLPQDVDYPCILIFEVSANSIYVNTIGLPRIQFSCYADSYEEAKTLSEVVISEYVGYCGIMDGINVANITYMGSTPIHEPKLEKFGFAIDFRIKFKK